MRPNVGAGCVARGSLFIALRCVYHPFHIVLCISLSCPVPRIITHIYQMVDTPSRLKSTCQVPSTARVRRVHVAAEQNQLDVATLVQKQSQVRHYKIIVDVPGPSYIYDGLGGRSFALFDAWELGVAGGSYGSLPIYSILTGSNKLECPAFHSRGPQTNHVQSNATLP